jgi:hypothetical protein
MLVLWGMDAATLYMIITMMDGTQRTHASRVPREMCERSAEQMRQADSQALVWCSVSNAPRPIVIAR